MSDPTWREIWSPFRVALIDETAKCLADQRAEATVGNEPSWTALSEMERDALTESIAWTFSAMDQALSNLDKRGSLP